jgi:hypothetical protein
MIAGVRALAVVIVLGTAASAAPRKPAPPTKAQLAAIQLASNWLAALPNAATPPLTANPFFAVIYDDKGTPCPPASDAKCLRAKLAAKGAPHVWMHTLGGPLAAERARLADKAAIVIELDEGCDGVENQTLIVTKAGKVGAVMAQTTECSE